MVEPSSLATTVAHLVNHADVWLPPIQNAFLSKGAEYTINKSLQAGRNWFHLDEKERLKHLKRALRNAAERSVARSKTQEDRDQWRNIFTILSEEGPHCEILRTEAMKLLTLSNSPDFGTLSELYNHALRFRTLTQTAIPGNIDVKPYLINFFDALRDEMYKDTLFHEQISDVLKLQGIANLQRSLTEVVTVLHQIGGALTTEYMTEQFEQDLELYTVYLERMLRHLKLVGVVPKDRSDENTDPELDAIFVPLRVTLREQDERKFVTTQES